MSRCGSCKLWLEDVDINGTIFRCEGNKSEENCADMLQYFIYYLTREIKRLGGKTI